VPRSFDVPPRSGASFAWEARNAAMLAVMPAALGESNRDA
jgi:hypothetical protein